MLLANILHYNVLPGDMVPQILNIFDWCGGNRAHGVPVS
jgi:hypothetical protein